MNKKFLLFGGIGAAVVAVAVILIIALSGGDKAYRSIIVVEADGNVSIKRDGDTLQAYANMKLRSGDGVEVPASGFARLKLDGDKYVYLEENTIISLQAEGDEKNSKTIIYVEQGNMLTEIESKLSEQSAFNVVTPNTTMAIRGTVTSTSVRKDYDDADKAITEYSGSGDSPLYEGDSNGSGKLCYITDNFVFEGETELTIYTIVGDDVVYEKRILTAGNGIHVTTPVEVAAGSEYVKKSQVKETVVFW